MVVWPVIYSIRHKSTDNKFILISLFWKGENKANADMKGDKTTNTLIPMSDATAAFQFDFRHSSYSTCICMYMYVKCTK